MIDEKTAEILVEKLVRRVEQENTYFLKKIGSSIKKIRNLKLSEAQKLVQILKYGGNYEEIIKKLSKYTNMNIKDLNKMFSSYAKKDQLFYEDFYKYKNVPFVPFDENISLQNQVKSITNIAKKEMYNFTRTNVLGYTIRNEKGVPTFTGLKETYNKVLNEALLNVGQGKETFDNAMTRILKDIGDSGLKTLEYESGRSIRLDSAVRMHLQGRLREMHNELQEIYGKEFDADGVEITVHENPAPDHQEAQGKQFSTKIKQGQQESEWEKLQSGKKAKTYDGEEITLDHDGKNGYRPISEMNCYHYIYSIILGVSKPAYSKKQLQEVIDRNNKGFEYDGKHYTMYEGTQLQRMLERKIRSQKDIQILARESGNEYLAGESQNKITALTKKYKGLSIASGLPTKIERMKVSKYKRSKIATKTYNEAIDQYKVGEIDITKYTKEIEPTTNEVVFMPDRKQENSSKHWKDVIYYEKIPEILNSPNQVYKETGKRKNTYWLIKDIDGEKVETIVKINVTSLYQEKQLGFKNSIIHLHRTREAYIRNKAKKGELQLLFDTNNTK